MKLQKEVKKKLKETAAEITSYLASQVSETGFPARTYYGELFSAVLFSQYRDKYSPEIATLLKTFQTKDTADPQFHWEFNFHAYQLLTAETTAVDPPSILANQTFRTLFVNKVTNWILLRSLVRVSTEDTLSFFIGIFQAWIALTCNINKDGIIYDDYLTKNRAYSDQYHAFSLALLAQLFDKTGISFFKKLFFRGLKYLLNTAKGRPDVIYRGRGANQIFGYASILYSLAWAWNDTNDQSYLSQLSDILEYLLTFQRNDGSFPLVLQKAERGYPIGDAGNNPKFPGWESYNNYFDYLPFLGVYLQMAAEEI